ncbi:MAG: hypothetical protein RIQ52_308 [Pseudomonadota bacterium]|jgi:flagellin
MSVINTNVPSLNTQQSLYKNQISQQNAMERLASGLRVNSAKDDAAGLAIANSMTKQIRGMGQAIRNSNDAISMVQNTESGISSIQDMLQRMRELAVQSQNTAAITETDKRKMNDEFQQLQTEIKRQVDDSTYNEKSILKGGMSHAVFQVGWFNSTTAQISVHVQSLTTASGIASIYARSLSIGSMQTSANIKTMVSTIDTALKTLDSDRSVLGAAQNRFISTINNLQSSVTNMSSAKSRIMDADFAAETATLSRAQILSQSATAMLAQANQNPQQVLSLLK